MWNDQIAKPTDVRYAWAYNPFISVENSGFAVEAIWDGHGNALTWIQNE